MSINKVLRLTDYALHIDSLFTITAYRKDTRHQKLHSWWCIRPTTSDRIVRFRIFDLVPRCNNGVAVGATHALALAGALFALTLLALATLGATTRLGTLWWNIVVLLLFLVIRFATFGTSEHPTSCYEAAFGRCVVIIVRVAKLSAALALATHLSSRTLAALGVVVALDDGITANLVIRRW